MREIHITDTVIIYNDIPGYLSKKYPKWHYTVYRMWKGMWARVYTNIHYFGSLIHPSFKYLSNYTKWIEVQPRFEEFCSTYSRTRWDIDKDAKYPGNKNYYPEYMTLMLSSENSIEAINRNGNPMLKEEYALKSRRKCMKPVLGIPLDDTKRIILTVARQDVSNYGFSPSGAHKCIIKKWKSYKGYKWYRINYKHNTHLRIKGCKFYDYHRAR